jgi:hypothetical protein
MSRTLRRRSSSETAAFIATSTDPEAAPTASKDAARAATEPANAGSTQTQAIAPISHGRVRAP